MASKLNSTKSNLAIKTNKLCDLIHLKQENRCRRNSLINERFITDLKTQLKKPKSVACHPIRSMEFLRPQNRNVKQLSSVSHCNITNRPLKLTKDKLACQINKRKPCQPIEPPPSQPNSLINKAKKNSSKTKLEKTPDAELSLIIEPAKVVQDIKKSPRPQKLSMDNSKFLKCASTSSNYRRPSSSTSNNNKLPSSSIQSTTCKRPIQSAKSNKTISKSSLAGWKSPFKTFITTGVRTRKSLYGCPESHEFSYDLSRDELKCWGRFEGPMKPAPEQERQLLTNGQRIEYLTQRYEHSPHNKYNYPEATSWRIGWLQQQQQQQKKQHVSMEQMKKN